MLAPLTTTVWAQRYYSKTDRLHALSARITGVQAQGAMLYTIGASWDSTNMATASTAYPNHGISLTSWESATGNRKSQYSIQKGYPALAITEARALEPQGADCFKALPDGGYLVATRTVDAEGIARIGLIGLNADGSQRFFKEYDAPAGSTKASLTVRSLAATAQGDWLVLAGATTDAAHNGEQDFLLLKLDAQGKLKWSKQYGDPGYAELPGRILVEQDGYTLVGSYTNEFSTADPAAATHQAQFIKVNTEGDVQWSWLSDPALHIAAVTDVVRTSDGGYLYCGLGDGVLQATADGEMDYSFRGWVEKLDGARTPQWHLSHVDAFSRNRENGHNRLLAMPEGDYLVAGTKCELSEEGRAGFKGGLTRFTKDGMVQWQRSYSAGAGNETTSTLADAALLPDGNIVLGGWVEQASTVPGTPLQQAWLLKVDRNGCIGSGDPQCPPAGVAPRMNGRELHGERVGAVLPARAVSAGIFRQAGTVNNTGGLR